MIISFSYNGDSYSNWNTESEEFQRLNIPNEEKVRIISEQSLTNVLQARKVAYQKESDPLYLEWQYDQSPESETAWRDKVAEIKARYPLPTE
ncbi:hypothetical protein C9I98_21630 [Photobacterium sanctipauli]|uniref:Uncharacterized protein n=1 Tax=Photobacterium sanctipauli TaxID=1342794 RepID=A0A2T3NIF0_9GAMM|nr:hypothetical protein [Photobacterium sanctipauli]PSW14789.1 hypothetical protein C9I98_21630 [Photobacterium sanctipauli]